MVRLLGAVHKRRPQSGRFVQCGHFADKGNSTDVRTYLYIKTSNFSKFILCPHGQRGGGLSQCGHFSDKEGREVNFSRFCADIFYGRLLP